MPLAAAPPVFVTVIAWLPELVPTFTLPKASEPGAAPTLGVAAGHCELPARYQMYSARSATSFELRPSEDWRPDMSATVSLALADAVAELTAAQGDDPAGWRWGRLHTLELVNATFGRSGIAPVEWLFNRGPAGTSGGDAIVNATGWSADEGYEVDAVPSMRMIVDMSNLDASRWIQLTGNSGHAFHDNYDDQFELWRTGGNIPMRWERATIEAAAVHTLTLSP